MYCILYQESVLRLCKLLVLNNYCRNRCIDFILANFLKRALHILIAGEAPVKIYRINEFLRMLVEISFPACKLNVIHLKEVGMYYSRWVSARGPKLGSKWSQHVWREKVQLKIIGSYPASQMTKMQL